MILNNADNILLGAAQVDKVMLGAHEVWSRVAYEELEWISNPVPIGHLLRPYVATDIHLNAFTDVMEVDAKFNPPPSGTYTNIPFGCASPRATDPSGRGQITYSFLDNAASTSDDRYYRYLMFYGTYGGGNYGKKRCTINITDYNDREGRMLIRMAPSPSITVNGHTYTPSIVDPSVDVYTFEPEDFTITSPLAIFSYAYMDTDIIFYNNTREWTFYGCKIYRSGALIHELVPARRLLDGEVGIYNKSTGAFYENLGDISFTAPAT